MTLDDTGTAKGESEGEDECKLKPDIYTSDYDSIRRAVWLSRCPGKSTVEKIDFLINFYESSRTIADNMLLNTPPLQSDDEGRPYVNLPEDMVNMTVDVYCKHCGVEGWMDVFVLEDGWGVENGVVCPVCGSPHFGFTIPLEFYEGL